MEHSDISRMQMTKAICGTLLLIAAGAGVWVRAESLGECEKFFGRIDMACKADAAAARMRGYSGSPSIADLLGDPLAFKPTDPDDLIGKTDDPLAD